jgi:hypothetical protein
MTRDIAAEKAGTVIPWNMNGWAGAFALLQSIKMLEMELETREKQKDQLPAIAERAKTWRFPLRDGLVLSVRDCTIQEASWTKADPCPRCGKVRSFDLAGIKAPHQDCTQAKSIVEDAFTILEPMLYVRTVRWKLAKEFDGR